MKAVSYCIVTPVRNEEEHFGRTIDSVVSQTIRPARWIIVDDGSTDNTGRIADEAVKHHDWITVVHRKDRGTRRAGDGVMEAFNAGLRALGEESWQYLVKLDGDVSFEPNYFERCFGEFAADAHLGIGGGLICNVTNGSLVPESKFDPPFHVRGATKIYKYECWQAIGGLVPAVGWDTVDEMKANMLGWHTRTFPELRIVHHRQAGAAYGEWSNWVKNGQANYFMGYHPLFMLLKCISRLFKRPFGIAALGLSVGFWGSYLERRRQVDDWQLIQYVRREQMKRLCLKSSLWG